MDTWNAFSLKYWIRTSVFFDCVHTPRLSCGQQNWSRPELTGCFHVAAAVAAAAATECFETVKTGSAGGGFCLLLWVSRRWLFDSRRSKTAGKYHLISTLVMQPHLSLPHQSLEANLGQRLVFFKPFSLNRNSQFWKTFSNLHQTQQ